MTLASLIFTVMDLGVTTLHMQETKLTDPHAIPIPHKTEDSYFSTGYPNASFTYAPYKPVVDEIATFNASNSHDPDGYIVSCGWDFGDGTNAAGVTVEHAYKDSGVHNVTLTVIDDAGLTDSSTLSVNVGKLSSSISISTFPTTITIRENTTISGSIAPTLEGIAVTIWYRVIGDTIWENLTTVTDDNSQYSYSWSPSEAGTYEIKASWTGDNYRLPAVSSVTILTCMKITTSISISASSSSTFVGFSVNVSGELHDIWGNALEHETVVLYYTFSGITTWTPITSDITDSLGCYHALWIPHAIGCYKLKAEWMGNVTHSGANNSLTLSYLLYGNEYVFTVESNSTISELAFDTKNWKLSFTAAGPNGTTGYVKVTVAKSLVANASDIRVFMDGRQLEYSVTSLDDSWLLTFSYVHSTHEVEINLGAEAADTTPPVVSILSPEQLTWYPESNVSLTFTVDEPVDWIGCSLNDWANVTITGNTTLSLSDGEYYVVVYANDTSGNMGASGPVHFMVDTTPPNIVSVSQDPPKDNVQPEDQVNVTAVITDNLSPWLKVTLNYTTNNETWISIPATTNEGSNYSTAIPQFPYCTNVTYTIIAEDDAGNTVTSEELGHTTQYHVIPEFPSLLVLPIVLVATLLAALVHRRKHHARAEITHAQNRKFLHKP